MRCLVVGAGIIGVTTAFRLAEAGGEVTLVDAATPGSGTTGTSFAWVNAGSKSPQEYFALNLAGMEAHRRLAADLGGADWLISTGNLEWALDADDQACLAARAEELERWGYQVERLSPHDVESRLEPNVVVGPGADQVFYYPDESFIHTELYLSALLAAAEQRGVRLRTLERVVALSTVGGRVTGAVTNSGAHLDADVLICCCGRWTEEVLGSAGVPVPLVSAAAPGTEAIGMLTWTTPTVPLIRRVLHPPDLAIRPFAAGGLLLHSLEADRQAAQAVLTVPPSGLPERVLECARRFVKHLEGASVQGARIGIRPIPEDGVSAVGWTNLENLYVIVTHSGVTLAPFLAEAAAREVHGSREPKLEPFRPDRFRSRSEQLVAEG